MKYKKYKFIKEIKIPTEDKYNLEKIVKRITDTCYEIKNPNHIGKLHTDCYTIGLNLLHSTYIRFNHTFKNVEIEVLVDNIIKNDREIYNFKLKFSIGVDSEKEYEIVKDEYNQRLLKFMYVHSLYDTLEEEEIEE